MKLQLASRLAVYAVLELAAQPDRQLSASQIAETYGVSTHHLAKVLHTLRRAGLVQSVRGAGGGFRFAGNARRTSVMDVIDLFEPFDRESSGSNEPGSDTPIGQALNGVLEEIDAIAQATLRSVSIATCLKLADKSPSSALASVADPAE